MAGDKIVIDGGVVSGPDGGFGLGFGGAGDGVGLGAGLIG